MKAFVVWTDDGREFRNIIADDEWHARRTVFAICNGKVSFDGMTVYRM